MHKDKFFQELKVVELASVLAGPAVGMFFAELGAEVIKIENKKTEGDVTRKWKLPQEDATLPYSAYYYSINWGKESIFLDLKDDEDYSQLLYLINKADVVISNYKAGSAEKLKVDAKTLMTHNPQLIYASISAYGENDPRPGFDVVMQAETAWMSMTGEPEGKPIKMPVALIDILAAHQLKEAILIALLKRYQTGKGAKVSVALFDASVAALANQATNWLNVSHIPQPMGSQHPNIAPYGDIFYTSDHKPLIVSTGTEKQYHQLLEVLSLSFLKTESRFKTNLLRIKNRKALNDFLASAFVRFTAAEVLTKCETEKIPVAPIRNMKELFELPEAQKLILSERLEDGQIMKSVKTAVFEFSESR